MLTRIVSLSFGVLLLSLAACVQNEEEAVPSATPLSNLSRSEIVALHQLAERLADEGILKPAVPLYIPAGLEHFPFQADGSPDGSTLVFDRDWNTSPQGEGPVATHLDISQGTGSTLLLEPPFIDLDGVMTSVQTVSDGEIAFYGLALSIGDWSLELGVQWQAPDGNLTDEMRRETERVAKSLVADFYDQGLAGAAE